MALLEVNQLKKYFPVRGGFFGGVKAHIQAVHDVSLSVNKGEILGLVGESGCGKSTLGRAILKLLEPDQGQIIFDGQDITKLKPREMRSLRRDMQIVFQDPYASLNPRMTAGAAVREPLTIHKVYSRRERIEKTAELFEMVGLSTDQMDKYPHEFSGGQRQRIGIARAIALKPRLLIADEPVSALDVSIQAQIINLLADLRDQFGLAMIFIAHDLKVVEHLSDRIVVMYLGRVMEMLPADKLMEAKHPYTRSLLSAIPIPNPKAKKERIILKGDVPSPLNPPSGCVFHTRCPVAVDACKHTIPPLKEIAPGQQAACILV